MSRVPRTKHGEGARKKGKHTQNPSPFKKSLPRKEKNLFLNGKKANQYNGKKVDTTRKLNVYKDYQITFLFFFFDQEKNLNWIMDW